MYRRYGFGLNRVALKAGDRPVGICGLLRREALPEADLGFALLPGFRGQGYACEAAQAVVGHGFEQLGLPRIVAIVTPRNRPSRRLLRSLGFGFEREIEMEPKRDLLDLYVIDR
jgi:RimJ/RimL family protein N-acetyltransferase